MEMPDEGNEEIALSFIVVNRNGEEIFPACLDSVFSQELEEPFEVIVVDDASTDGSVGLVRKSYPRARLVVQGRNSGPAAAKNAGAAVARGRVLAFLDNDVVLEEGWARSMLLALDSDPGAGAGASHLMLEGSDTYLNSTGGLVNLLGYAWERGIYLPDSKTYSLNREVAYACSAAMAVKRDVFEQLGGFDPSYFYLYEDVDLGWRMNILGYRVIYVPEARARHRLSATMGLGGWRNEYLSVRNRLYTLLKNTEASTLRMVFRESIYRLFHDGAFYNYGNGGMGIERTLVPWRALAWNIVRWPYILRARKSIRSVRRVSDAELIAKGIILPTLDFPEIGQDPRIPYGTHRAPVRGRAPRRLWIGKRGCRGLLYGWYEPERSSTGIPFRWTGERAVFRIRRRYKGGELFLVTLGGHPDGASEVEVWIGGVRVGELEVGNEMAIHRLPLPREGPGGGGDRELEVEIRVANPFVPALVGDGMDGRLLGIGVAAAGICGVAREG
jgi:GT2 family glycosyltransferase